MVDFGDAVISGSKEGGTIVPNISRINAIRNMRRARTKKELQVNLGTVRSLLKWFPDLNTSTPNIADFVTQGKRYSWTAMIEEEFLEVQRNVGSPAILSPFDKTRKTYLYTDASRINGVGFLLLQEDKKKNESTVRSLGEEFLE